MKTKFHAWEINAQNCADGSKIVSITQNTDTCTVKAYLYFTVEAYDSVPYFSSLARMKNVVEVMFQDGYDDSTFFNSRMTRDDCGELKFKSNSIYRGTDIQIIISKSSHFNNGNVLNCLGQIIAFLNREIESICAKPRKWPNGMKPGPVLGVSRIY